MYAIIFDFDVNSMRSEFNSKEIKIFMENNGFEFIPENVFLGKDPIDSVTCVLTVQRLKNIYPWFATCVKSARMLRIEEDTDLLPAISSTVSILHKQ